VFIATIQRLGNLQSTAGKAQGTTAELAPLWWEAICVILVEKL
jgi:hypothetical protein